MIHRKHVTLTLTFVVLAIIMCAPAAFGQATTQDLQFSNSPVTNDCNGETILMSGTLHSEMSFSTNSNGMTHTNYNFTIHMTGIGETSGVNYVANDSSHQEVNTRGIAQEQSFGTKTKLISQGPQTPNMTDRMTLHVVIDQNNNAKVD